MCKFINSTFPTSDYIYSLDGLRAFSIILVIISHLGYGHIVPGGFGVTVFFFISGFLITRLLLLEMINKDDISLKYFI